MEGLYKIQVKYVNGLSVVEQAGRKRGLTWQEDHQSRPSARLRDVP